MREAHFSTNFDPHARWGHEFCEKPSPLRPKTRHDRQNTLPDASRHIQTSKFPRSELLLDVQDASRRSDGGPNPKNNFAKQHKAMRINRRNRSQHEIAGIETSTKSQPARNHSQHSQSETATSTKSQPALIRSQHSQHDITVSTVRAKPQPARNRSQHEIAGIETSTKSQPARNRSQHSQSETATSTKSQPARIRSQHSQHEITANTKSQPPRNRRRKLGTHQCNEAQLQR